MQKLGDWVRAQREQRDWRQQDLAEAIQGSVRSVQNLENGESRPQRKSLAALADVFGVSFEYVLAMSRGKEVPVNPIRLPPADEIALRVPRETASKIKALSGRLGAEKWLVGLVDWMEDQDPAVQMLVNKSVERRLDRPDVRFIDPIPRRHVLDTQKERP